MLLKISLRNIFRNKRRTTLTVGMMVFGYVLFSFFLSLGEGAYGDIITQFINARTGEIQIHEEDYLENPKLYKAIDHYKPLLKKLESHDYIKSVAPRVKGHALAFLNNKTMGAVIMGIDARQEFKVTTLLKRLTYGRFFQSNSDPSIVIGRKVAKTLKASLGDQIIFISSGADGSIANDKFKVIGIIDSGQSGLDDRMVYMPINLAQEFFSLWGRVHEIVVRTQHKKYKEVAILLKESLDKKLSVSTWEEVEKDFFKAMEADKKGNLMARLIIMLVVAIGVLNTVLMSIMERQREFGILKALGTPPKFLFFMITFETFFIGVFSIIIGTIIAFIVNYYFSIHGIPFDNIEYGGFSFNEMRTTLEPIVFIIPSYVIIFVSVVVSLFPAMKAARVIPVEAMRS